MTLEERVSRWPEPYIRQGIEEGIKEGIEEGIREGIEEGIKEGLERGRKESLDEQRALLRRQAAARFGARATDRLFARLRQEESQERLGEMGEAIVRCETTQELLRRIGA